MASDFLPAPRWWVSASTLMTALALTPPLAAQTPPEPAAEPSAADKETARNLMDMGRVEHDRGNYEAALEAFRGADEIMGVTSTGLWMGKALAKLGRLIEARDKLLEVARLPQGPDESEVLRRAREEAASLQVEVADRIPELTFQIDGLVAPAQPTVEVDGQTVPSSTLDLPRKVDPGRHEIVATAPGHFELRLTVEVAERDRQKVSLLFRPNGEPITPPDTEPGTVTAGDDGAALEADEGLSGLAITSIVTGSLGAAGLVVGAVTGGLSLSKASSAKEGCQGGVCPAANEPDRDSSVALAHVSTTGFVIGGVGAAVATVTLVMELTGDDHATAADVGVTPLVGPGFVGLQGRF